MDRDDRLEKKIDKALEHISSIDSTLSAQHESLKIHIHRTNLLESKMEKQEAFSNKISGALKLLGSAGIIMAVIKLFLRT